MATTSNTASSASWDNVNGPDSPPVVGDCNIHQPQHQHVEEEDEERCRNCASTNLLTDWKQGDRVCTDCGVVAEERLRDDRPEWKDFNDAEDLVKKGSTSVANSSARSGMVAVDESKYIGGLQPTTLSKLPFGGSTSGGYGLAKIQRRLRTTNRRLDMLMEKQHKHELKDAKMEREIHTKKDKHNHPERYHVLHEEHDEDDAGIAQRHAALHNEKWSLDRAMLLYGNDQEESTSSSAEDREELKSRLDLSLQTASRDLYNAYTNTTLAIQDLDLPDKVRQEIIHRLVRYAIQRDGLTVKGVSNRLSKKEASGSSNMLRHSASERKKLNDRLKDYNKRKQSSALGAALIHLTAKSMGHPRAIAKICACFLPPPESTVGMDHEQVKKATFVKGKHCSKAINEIKATFPEYVEAAAKAGANIGSSLQVPEIPDTIWSPKVAGAIATTKTTTRSALADPHISESVDNFAHHFLKTLQLPPVAEASIQTLLLQCRKEQIQLGKYSGVDMSTMCAAITYFVCSTGSIMQNLAQQVQQEEPPETAKTDTKEGGKKKRKSSASDTISSAAKRTKRSGKNNDDGSSSDDDSLGGFNLDSLVGTKPTKQEEEDDEEPFDVFSHAPIVEDQSEKQRYEMRRMWDAWKEQMPWARSPVGIEQSCGVARNKLTDFYSTELYPQRDRLLEKLRESASDEGGEAGVLQSTPMARTLLSVVSTAASLMTSK
ncbi:unnamed protein product [Cylindrotheca closterium]|uniref:General transcription factor TFIIB n=1 Tax=Cylindrotheca closterium TaxID=2856 RepID=A0AAD2JH72_9STRA|nr:unnamed protein product [Cylindrotheca closterium]